jgi:hypothetical protein
MKMEVGWVREKDLSKNLTSKKGYIEVLPFGPLYRFMQISTWAKRSGMKCGAMGRGKS